MEEQEVWEAIKARAEYIEAKAIADAIAQAEGEMQGVEKAALTFAERAVIALEEAITAILNAFHGCAEPGKTRRALNRLDIAAIRERKETREKLRAAERENASRFRQYKIKETAWTVQKRTGPRRREWHGPWKENRP